MTTGLKVDLPFGSVPEFRVAGRLTEYVNQMLESHTSQGCQSWSSDSDSN